MNDGTNHSQNERTTSDALAYAEAIIDTVRDPLLVLDEDLRVQTASRSFYRTFHVSKEETQGKLIYELGNEQWDIPELRRLLTEILPTNRSFDDYEVTHEFPSIGQRYMRLNARRLHREENHVGLILLSIEDITELRRAENERREWETRFTSLVKNIRDHSIFTLDMSGCITSWNLEAEKILGYSEHEALGQHFSIIFTPDDLEQNIPQQELDAANETGRAEDERWHRRKNGELFWALGIVTPTRDAEGNHTGYSKILRDITDRKRAHEALLRQSGQLRLLWDSAELLLMASNPQQMMQTMMHEMFERVSEHLDVDAFFNFIADKSGQHLRLASFAGISEDVAGSIERLEFGQAICGTVALQKKPIIATHVQQSDDAKVGIIKSLRIRSYVCHPLMIEDRLFGTLSFASRRTDRFDREELAFLKTLSHYVTVAFARLQLVEELQKAHQRKDEFLATLAHELRNPLAPIRSGLDILALEQTEHQETVELMQTQVEHVVRLVDDLLDVSRIMRSRIDLRREPVELSQLIRQSVQAIRPSIEENDQQLVVSQSENQIYLDADGVRVVQIVGNLLSNASKYTEPGGRIELRTEQQDEMASITVQDTGVGIDQDLLPHVFDLFTQSDRSLDRSQGGLGIGLTLVKQLVEMHEGTVHVHSDGPGHGSTFLVRLPIAQAGTKTPDAVEQPATHADRRIVVVDDNKGATLMLSKLLTKLGDHEIFVAHDGSSALTKIKEVAPEIVLLDIGLPGMDGYAVGKALRELSEFDDLLLVALTGYGQEEDRRKSMEAGFDKHLTKPPSLDQMRKILVHPKLKSPVQEPETSS